MKMINVSPLGQFFMNLRKAFDTANHNILLKKLEHYRYVVRGIVNNLITPTYQIENNLFCAKTINRHFYAYRCSTR